MERFIKWRYSIQSKEYDVLLKKEIETWWETSNWETTYNEAKKTIPYKTYRFGIIDEEFQYIGELKKQNLKILELWWSNGWLSNELAKIDNVNDITCIDISLNEEIAVKKIENKTLILLKGDLNKMGSIKFDTDGYDIIITHGTLHHIVDPQALLTFSMNNLLKKWGLFIINDTYKLNRLQLKTNALIVVIFIKIPKFLVEIKLLDLIKSFLYIPCVIFNKNFAASIAHNHAASPFESISSYEDYEDIYKRKDLKILVFRRFAAIPAIFGAIDHYPFKELNLIKNIITLLNRLDKFLIRKNLFSWDAHLTIFKKYE